MIRKSAVLIIAIVIAITAQAQTERLLSLSSLMLDEFQFPLFVKLSPDDQHAYILSQQIIVVCQRNTVTGAVTPIQSVLEGFEGVAGLDGIQDLTFSPDGKFLYICAQDPHTLARFSRDESTGRLTFIDLFTNLDPGLESLRNPRGVAIAPDGTSLYVAGKFMDTILVFDRDTSTGALTLRETQVNNTGAITLLDGPESLVVSNDGADLYAITDFDSSIVHFNRDAGTGALTFVASQQNGVGSVINMLSPEKIRITSDDKSVYVSSTSADAIVNFARNTTNGVLTYVDDIANADAGVSGLRNINDIALSADDVSLYSTNSGDHRFAVLSRDAATGTLSFVEVETQGDPVAGLRGPFAIAPSRDGKHTYVALNSSDGVAIFDREPTQGAVVFSAFLNSGPSGIDSLSSAQNIALSPDGANAYVTAVGSSALAVFDRDQGTGQWTFRESFIQGRNGIDGLSFVDDVAVSPDGSHVYTTARIDDAVAIFSRDAGTGALTFFDIVKDGVGAVDGLDDARAVALTSDGNFLYAVGSSDAAVAAFSRNSTTGALTFIEAIFDDNTTIDGLNGVVEIAISPDDKHLYTVSATDDAIAIFSINAANGELTFIRSIFDGIDVISAIEELRGVAISADGRNVYTASERDDAVAVFNRDETTGNLTFVERFRNNSGGVTGLNGTFHVEVSPDGGHVYAVSNDVSVAGLVVFSRDLTTGQLTFGESHEWNGDIDFENEVTRGIRGATGVAVSQDSAYIHVAAATDAGVSIFEKGVVNFLRGTVTEMESGNPVTCGVVEIANGDRSVVETAVTDARGFYFFTNIPFGTYEARVISPGLGEVSVPSITLGPGQFAVENIELPLGSVASDIAGLVTDAATTLPLVGVLVDAAINGMSVATTYTCATGAYEIDLPGIKGATNEVTLTFSLENYDTAIQIVNVTPGELLTVNQPLTKNIGVPGTLTGIVLDIDNNPISVASVTIRGPLNASTSTDVNGQFAFDVTDGDYTIRASKAGYVGETGTRSITGGSTAIKSFNLELDSMQPAGDPEDTNEDGNVNAVDIQIVINSVLGVPTTFITDIDNSGTTNSVDIQLVINKVLGV